MSNVNKTANSSLHDVRRLAALDSVRGLAIVMVLFSHSVIYNQSIFYSELMNIGLAAGSAGVTVFFVLSGFLITGILLREKDRTGAINFKRFYIRRALRLWPALWIFLLVVSALGILGFLQDSPWHSILSSVLSIRNLIGRGHETAHLWSLSIEEQAYFLWPLFIVALASRRRILLAFLFAIVIVTPIWRFLALEQLQFSSGTVYMRTDFRLDALATGAILAVLKDRIPECSKFAALVGGGGLVLALFFQSKGFFHQSIEYSVYSGCGIALVQAARFNVSANFFPTFPMAYLGRMSYSLYLWQQIFLGPEVSLYYCRLMPLALCLTLIVGAASYFLVECPIDEWKNRVWSSH